LSTASDHLRQARENKAFAEELLITRGTSPLHVQWAVTAAFYCAVHCMQAHLLTQGFDPTNHGDRGLLIHSPNVGIPVNVQDAYFWLKNRSERARYRLATFDPAWVQRTVLDDRLKKVTDFVGL
jgi:hypothetical protein